MRFPWANLALAGLFAAELVTGYLGLTHSSPEWLAAMHLHRILGFAILALLLWKGRNIYGSLRSGQNWRRAGGEMALSLALLVGLLAVLGLGLWWSHFGSYHLLGFSGTTVHLNLALLLVPLLVWHSVRHRIAWRRRYLADRRHLLRLGGLALAGLLVWRTAELAGILASGPGRVRRGTGSYPEDGADFPVTMWLNDRVPYVDGEGWRLRVDGYVEDPYEVSLAELKAGGAGGATGDGGPESAAMSSVVSAASVVSVRATLDCTGGWYTTRVWEGAAVGDLLARARPKAGAGSITIRSRTGYFRRYSLSEARRAVLAWQVDGAALSAGHGYPARMVEPHKRGYDWVKWVDSITVNDTGKWWQPPLPLS